MMNDMNSLLNLQIAADHHRERTATATRHWALHRADSFRTLRRRPALALVATPAVADAADNRRLAS
jgi:hypothetical protein